MALLSRWVFILLFCGTCGHDVRTGTGRALHPEVRAMSLSAQGEAKEETMPRKKRVIRKERRAQRNADAPDEAAETAEEVETTEESADVDTTLSSDAATADAATDDTEATGDTTTEVAVVDESVDVSSTTEAGAATMDATSTTQVEADSSTAEEASGGPSPPNKEEEAVLEPASSVPSETFGQEDPAKAFENIGADGPVVQELPTPDACDSGGTSLPTRPYTFDVNAPSSVPFTLSFRTSWSGEDPPKMEPNPVCIICWTIDPDTKPSNNKAQFFRGIDGQPPRIALMRMGNVVSYEEFSADGEKGTANSLTSATKLNDESEHEVVLVRGESKISMWIDGKPDCSLDASSIDFQNKDLPKGRPGHVAGKAATTNEYLRRQVKKTASYNKMDPFRGNWALSGDVTNVRLYSKELTANDFPDSKQSCEQTTTAEPFECHNTCKGCKGPTAKDCLSCMGMRFLHERQCIEDCPDGHFGEKDSNICLPCHDSCATCNAPKENDCQSCPSTYALHEGKCMSACPANYFADLNSVCQPLSGAVIALKTGGLGQAYLVTSNQTECVQLVPLESEEFSDPSKFIRDEAKMWMISASGDKATLRNVKTGMALHWKAIEPGSEKVEGCTSEVSSCAVARPPKAVYGESALWTDSQWAIHKCQKSVFNILSLGGGKISLQQESRNLQFTKDVLSFSSEKIKDLSMEPESEAESEGLEVPDNSRFEPLVILKALKVTQKSSGRCQQIYETWIVQEWCDRGTLHGSCKEPRLESEGLHEALEILIEICRAGLYLHDIGLIHGDLTSNNVLLKSMPVAKGFVCKVCDFGLARVLEEDDDGEIRTNSLGTISYMPPEVLTVVENAARTKKTDVYSLGIIAFIVLTAKEPFTGFTAPQVVIQVSRGKRPVLPDSLPAELLSNYQSTLSEAPEERPTFSELVDAFSKIYKDLGGEDDEEALFHSEKQRSFRAKSISISA